MIVKEWKCVILLYKSFLSFESENLIVKFIIIPFYPYIFLEGEGMGK